MIVITGLRAEARIASAPGVSVFACGGNVGRRAHAIKRAVSAGAPAILSFGIAGALKPGLKPGDIILSTEVVDEDRRWLSSDILGPRLAELVTEIGAIEGPVDLKKAIYRPYWSSA